MKSLTSACPSVCPPVTKFSQDWIIIFSDIVHDHSLPWYLVTDEARFLEKKLAVRI